MKGDKPMKVCLTLDYELFLGEKTGTVENCLLMPMMKMLESVDTVGAKFTIFVDATYLCALKHHGADHPSLADDLKKIRSHLCSLKDNGHDIQLHIHPQWQYSSFDGQRWAMDAEHYKLSDLGEQEAMKVFAEAKDLLDGIIGVKTTCYRAGGFSTQPTALLTKLFAQNGVQLDASVCPGTRYESPQQSYDYKAAPIKGPYSFETDINVPQADGRFVEVPITMCRVSPFFHWRLAFNRVLKSPRQQLYGDGVSVKTTSDSIFQRLLHYTDCMATIDGYKIKFLKNAYLGARKAGHEVMCVLGHPKLATPHSVAELKKFCIMVAKNNDSFTTLSSLLR